jgi:hypothetical protein
MRRTSWALVCGLFLLACCPGQAAFIFNPSNGHWYTFTSAKMSWSAARAEATTAGGYLASITSAAEQSFIVSNFLADYTTSSAFPQFDFRTLPLWIGGTDDPAQVAGASTGNFRWVSGEAFANGPYLSGPSTASGTFTAWFTGEPNHTSYVLGSGATVFEDYIAINWHYSSNPVANSTAQGL